VNSCGGRKKWADWVNNRATSFSARAKRKSECPEKHTVPRWREAVVCSLNKMPDNRAHFSKLPLSLKREATDPLYPSADHLENPENFHLVLETRLVNDMKTILTESEFKKVLAHLVWALKIKSRKLPENWQCQRDFR